MIYTTRIKILPRFQQDNTLTISCFISKVVSLGSRKTGKKAHLKEANSDRIARISQRIILLVATDIRISGKSFVLGLKS